MKNNIFLNDLYIHIISIAIIMIFSFFASIYILFDDNCYTIIRVISIFIIACVIFLAIRKETFLPFLGISFIPNTLLINNNIHPVGANISYTIDMSEYEDNTKIIYWAANNKGKIFENPYEAYDNFSNSGVSSVKNGKAKIHIFCPDKYKVNKGFTKILGKHFHYRIVFKNSGFLSPIMTVKVEC